MLEMWEVREVWEVGAAMVLALMRSSRSRARLWGKRERRVGRLLDGHRDRFRLQGRRSARCGVWRGARIVMGGRIRLGAIVRLRSRKYPPRGLGMMCLADAGAAVSRSVMVRDRFRHKSQVLREFASLGALWAGDSQRDYGGSWRNLRERCRALATRSKPRELCKRVG